MTTITSEIRIHDAIGNASLIGTQAIRVRFNPTFDAPATPGYHLFDRNSKFLRTLHDYQLAIDASRYAKSKIRRGFPRVGLLRRPWRRPITVESLGYS